VAEGVLIAPGKEEAQALSERVLAKRVRAGVLEPVEQAGERRKKKEEPDDAGQRRESLGFGGGGEVGRFEGDPTAPGQSTP